jgi:hypothetical protein
MVETIRKQIRRAMGETQVALGYAEHGAFMIEPKIIRRIARALRATVDTLDALPGEIEAKDMCKHPAHSVANDKDGGAL